MRAGRPAVFCRFSGCNLWSGREADRAQATCRFCDTDFVGTDGKENEVSSTQRLRFMFLAGVMAETEASLRAVATATVKANYGLTVAKRAARAGARLKSVAEKVSDPRLEKAVLVFDSVQIKLNNATPLAAAADKLAIIGYDLAEAETKTGIAKRDVRQRRCTSTPQAATGLVHPARRQHVGNLDKIGRGRT